MLQKIDDVLVEYNQEVSVEELAQYVKYARNKFPYATWNKLIVTFDGDEVVLGYDFINEPFQRLRRITGYLSDTVNWNNAKQDELKHRTKHRLEQDDGKE